MRKLIIAIMALGLVATTAGLAAAQGAHGKSGTSNHGTNTPSVGWGGPGGSSTRGR
jgi:hypothetical protein